MYGEQEAPHAECRATIKELEAEVARCHRELEQASDRLLATAELEAEVERLRAAILEMDRRFGHFAAMHIPDADASPVVLLGDLANMVREAAKAGGCDGL